MNKDSVAKSKPTKKHGSKFQAKSSVRIKPVKKSVGKKLRSEIDKPKDYGWMVVGIDQSLSSIAGAAIAFDKTLNKLAGPVFFMERWSKEDHYFDRLKFTAKGQDVIFALMGELKLGNMPLSKIYIAQEEPFPPHSKFISGGNSNSLKQQAEMSGAFLGGLLRYGYDNIWQMHNTTWRGVIAKDLGITTYHAKWKDPALCAVYNCKPDDTGKFRAKQWALTEGFSPFDPDKIPDWPDIIASSKLGKIPRPEGSTAKAVQPDDRYDALAIMQAQYLDLKEQGVLKWLK